MRYFKLDGVVYAYDDDQVKNGLSKGKKELSRSEIDEHLSRYNSDPVQDVDNLRKRAYADPIDGSDRLFSESTRMQIMGENDFEEVLARAIARFEEIQAKYPWPTE